MQISLPALTVIDRDTPYALSYVEVAVFEDDESADVAHLDLGQMKLGAHDATEREAQRRNAPDRYIRIDVGSRFLQTPGDPSPFEWRDPGPVNCGALSGVAAIYCAVMSRR